MYRNSRELAGKREVRKVKKTREEKMGRKMNAKNTIRVPEDLSKEDLAKRRAKRRAQENEAPSDHQR